VLSKAFGIAQGNLKLTGRVDHGVSLEDRKPRVIPGALIKFPKRAAGAFQQLLQQLGGNPAVLTSPLRLGYLLPQILPGHRLWCYATRHRERFVSVESFELFHHPASKEVWLNLYLEKDNVDRLGIPEKRLLSWADLHSDFEIVSRGLSDGVMLVQQKTPDTYIADPAEALIRIVDRMRNTIWETVKISSPYRKPYLYCAPPAERSARMPQILSIYLLMFFLGSVTRYSPLYFDLPAVCARSQPREPAPCQMHA